MAKQPKTTSETNTKPILPRIKVARFAAADKFPYFAALLWALEFIPVEGMVEKMGAGGPIAVDKRGRCYYDPEVIMSWSVAECATVLIHEISHLLREHHNRADRLIKGHCLDPKSVETVINIFQDSEINDDFKNEPWPKNPEPWMPDKCNKVFHLNLVDGDFFENYFSKYLEKYPPKQGNSAGQDQNPDQGSGQNQTQDQSQGQNPGKQSNQRQTNCGSVAHGQPQPWEKPENDEENPGLGEVEKEILRRQTAQAILDHAQKGVGKVPAGLARWAKAKLTVNFDPRKELQAAIRNAVIEVSGQVDYSWQKRSHRHDTYEGFGIFLPGMKQPVPNIAVVVDTSGSMSTQDLEYCIALIDKVLKSLGQRAGVDVLCVDAALHVAKKVFNTNQVELAGGGGTDMRIGLEAASNRKPRPDIIILATDGGTPWPSTPLKIKTIVALVGDWTDISQLPKWTKNIKIDRPKNKTQN